MRVRSMSPDGKTSSYVLWWLPFFPRAFLTSVHPSRLQNSSWAARVGAGHFTWRSRGANLAAHRRLRER